MSAAVSLEIERKYDVDPDTPLPDWAALPGVDAVDAPEARALDARYLDTPDARLAGALTALRRRTGGPDEGWHVKRSTPEGKLETHWPLGEDPTDPDADPVVPDAVLAELAAVAPGPFAVIARIRNARTAYALRDAAGGLVAEFVDDHVTATDRRRDVETTWREWELELGPAAPQDAAARAALFAAADALVAAAGGRVSASASKLGRALGV
ncbi:CYTH domain-containing protein [Microbacterium telephonicum]|uniref:CYTH domain-containing protein n=1 Tax=Microbacterium telephonicum TaxID=1714841 RepID=A0A498C2C0_9MICO|nr:CYTH domain-containing protein [Microbacterium telephonicum]RLK49685.1 CYTH domain-containing protein [Microbacterium telephonicum]